MHLHCHLRSCIVDYGPFHGFWCYAFERINGILGAMSHNNRSIEIQLTNRFLQESQYMSASYPIEFSEYFKPLLSPRHSTGSVADTLFAQDVMSDTDQTINWTMDSPSMLIKVPLHCSPGTLTSREKSNLFQLYCKLYSVSDYSNVVMPSAYMKYSHLYVNGKILGSHKSRTASSSIVIASWKASLFQPCSEEAGDVINRAARIYYFCQHSVTINGVNKTHILAYLSWFLYHPKKSVFGKPITVWYNNLYEPGGVHTLVPVQLVKCRAVFLAEELDHEDVCIVIPCINF